MYYNEITKPSFYETEHIMNSLVQRKLLVLIGSIILAFVVGAAMASAGLRNDNGYFWLRQIIIYVIIFGGLAISNVMRDSLK
jgi:hypothetical protein